ncbi:M20/M25/M40 family metallo-hydrolase [candidate division WWE3 bacterium]|uniref:M20/M25/M40 family metallo-hydrolase n=1 Tax=candidate division WWE3 bacterium TaxID=2053526 RepID=A0A955LVM5_UNCKA|nr:M20/M25/M40 family metallo-hydrolase [candidate division WWE3 bacterium]
MTETYLSLLNEFIAFKSISTDSYYKDEVTKTADWLVSILNINNFQAERITGYGHPIVYGYYEASPEFATVLVYGHYDVQPASKDDGWQTDPFKVDERDGRLYARGIVDNKGQVLIHIATIIDLIKENKLQYNIKFLIEGDEETGGEGISEVLNKNPEKFSCDFAIISDGEMPYRPVITASFRGIINLTITMKTAKNNLHSGLYGGAVPNAAEELSKLLAMFYDDNYSPQIEQFYDGQLEMTNEETQLSLEMDEYKKDSLKHTGVRQFFPSEAGSISGKIGFFTMMTVTGIKAGYIGEGYSNIVPNTAQARINFRIAAGQNPQDVYNRFKTFVIENTPQYVDVTISEPTNVADPIKIDINTNKHLEAKDLLKKVYGNEVLVDYCGAIIPVVGDIQKHLNVEPILISLCNDDCNMHGVDENFAIELIEKGLAFSRRFFSS